MGGNNVSKVIIITEDGTTEEYTKDYLFVGYAHAEKTDAGTYVDIRKTAKCDNGLGVTALKFISDMLYSHIDKDFKLE